MCETRKKRVGDKKVEEGSKQDYLSLSFTLTTLWRWCVVYISIRQFFLKICGLFIATTLRWLSGKYGNFDGLLNTFNFTPLKCRIIFTLSIIYCILNVKKILMVQLQCYVNQVIFINLFNLLFLCGKRLQAKTKFLFELGTIIWYNNA